MDKNTRPNKTKSKDSYIDIDIDIDIYLSHISSMQIEGKIKQN